VVERAGYRVDYPDAVAERAVLGLVRGENEIILGGMLGKLGFWVERYAPFLIRLYWRISLTPEWIAAMSRIGR
jgi:hypothetical protein